MRKLIALFAVLAVVMLYFAASATIRQNEENAEFRAAIAPYSIDGSAPYSIGDSIGDPAFGISPTKEEVNCMGAAEKDILGADGLAEIPGLQSLSAEEKQSLAAASVECLGAKKLAAAMFMAEGFSLDEAKCLAKDLDPHFVVQLLHVRAEISNDPSYPMPAGISGQLQDMFTKTECNIAFG